MSFEDIREAIIDQMPPLPLLPDGWKYRHEFEVKKGKDKWTVAYTATPERIIRFEEKS